MLLHVQSNIHDPAVIINNHTVSVLVIVDPECDSCVRFSEVVNVWTWRDSMKPPDADRTAVYVGRDVWSVRDRATVLANVRLAKVKNPVSNPRRPYRITLRIRDM